MRSTQERLHHMRVVAEHLVSYTYPNKTLSDDMLITPLKIGYFDVDGYHIMVSLSKSEYKDIFIESLQLQSVYMPYLPFAILCKMAKVIFGNKPLMFTEFHKDNKKVYCWIVRYDKNGSVLASIDAFKNDNFEGFSYKVIEPHRMDFTS